MIASFDFVAPSQSQEFLTHGPCQMFLRISQVVDREWDKNISRFHFGKTSLAIRSKIHRALVSGLPGQAGALGEHLWHPGWRLCGQSEVLAFMLRWADFAEHGNDPPRKNHQTPYCRPRLGNGLHARSD
jgi:hypothetical protein